MDNNEIAVRLTAALLQARASVMAPILRDAAVTDASSTSVNVRGLTAGDAVALYREVLAELSPRRPAEPSDMGLKVAFVGAPG